MKIILSQRIDIQSDYDDVPFSSYHFPKRYRNQIKSGYRFIYYQGDRRKREHRYYFGSGVIGSVEPDASGESYYAEVLEGRRFSKGVPIYLPDDNGYVESLGYAEVRNKPTPSWQNSIRKISNEAFNHILDLAEIDIETGENTSNLESENNALDTLKSLNQLYVDLEPKERAKKIQSHLDRGNSVTTALKKLLGTKCQICEWEGFKKKNGDGFIEAHHIVQISEKTEGSLCTENIILLCPNCHREVHYGKDFAVSEGSDFIEITLSNQSKRIHKNTMEYLAAKND